VTPYTDEVIAILRAYGMSDEEIKTSEFQVAEAFKRKLEKEVENSKQPGRAALELARLLPNNAP
jgi:hypothetical protein